MAQGVMSNNTVFYCTADDKYALYAATALLSIRKYCHSSNLFIIGRKFSDTTKNILSKNNIASIEIDLSSSFSHGWLTYPPECYYLFAGPEYFYQLGYQYSVYIDGDILCLSDPLNDIGDLSAIAGVKSSKFDHALSYLGENAMERLHKIWSFDSSKDTLHRLSSGVVYFNNEVMNERRLFFYSQSFFQTCLKNDLLCSGDDALFALLQLLLFEPADLKALGPKYNFMPIYFGFKAKREELVFLHFDRKKPWYPDPFTNQKHPEYEVYNTYVKEWLDIYQTVKAL